MPLMRIENLIEEMHMVNWWPTSSISLPIHTALANIEDYPNWHDHKPFRCPIGRWPRVSCYELFYSYIHFLSKQSLGLASPPQMHFAKRVYPLLASTYWLPPWPEFYTSSPPGSWVGTLYAKIPGIFQDKDNKRSIENPLKSTCHMKFFKKRKKKLNSWHPL